MTDIATDFRETVRARTDIVALISESVALRSVRGGREYVGLCPFHDDHNPSLHVYPDRQTFRCWVCEQGGDCFNFLMEEAKIGFREALEMLAKRAGVPIPQNRKHSSKSGSSESDKATAMEALLWAQELFHETLLNAPSAAPAREYLAKRGFTESTIKKFKLGFHPDDWEWLIQRSQGKFTCAQLQTARLVGRREKGPGYFDYFVNRLLFPIWNERGQPVAFGGRVLPGQEDGHGKYWNSPESPVFHKSRLVYALNLAREAIKREETVVVTEGYTDCIAAHQAGITNVVGTLGTALTEQHVSTMRRFSRRVVLVYDGDMAGQMAAERAVEKFLAQDVDLRILTLPEGQDPADFLEARGAEAFRALIGSAPEAWEYKFRLALEKYGLSSLDDRQRILDEMLELLCLVPRMSRHVREALLLSTLSQRLNIAEQQVRDRYRELRKAGRRAAPRPRSPSEPQPPVHQDIARILQRQATAQDRRELAVIEAFLSDPRLLNTLQSEISPEDFDNRGLRKIFEIGLSFAKKSSVATFEQVLGAMPHADLKRLVVWIDDQARAKGVQHQLQEIEADDDCPLFLRRSIDNLKWRREEQSHQQAATKLAAQGDGSRRLDAEAEALLRKASEFHKRRATRNATG